MRFVLGFLRWGMGTLLALLTFGLFGALGVYIYLAKDMPDVETLRDVQLQVPLRVFSRDGLLISEYGEQRRQPIALSAVPEQVQLAFLAAEDDRFYEHPGVDYQGILRAALNLATTGERTQGGSTITMQIARNFFLHRDKTYTRKLTEIFLALKIERELSKDEIFELYLNKIYLGQRAYGVVAAAHVYYGTTLDQLNLAQVAMIAGLPTAPSAANPINNPARAIARRNYVLGRMFHLGYISEDAFRSALSAPVTARMHTPTIELSAAYVGEMARLEMISRFGERAYTEGYRVITSVDAHLQAAANDALRLGLMEYDTRHGYRGPEGTLDLSRHADEAAWDRELANFARVGGWLLPALVMSADEQKARVYLGGGRYIALDLAAVSWARRYISESRRGPAIRRVNEVLAPGHIIRVFPTDEATGVWKLSQVPEVGGALVALNPADGAVLALVGGYDFFQSHFNRAVQAERQAGSAFKPFIFAAAFAQGYSPASVINDAPIVIRDPSLPGGFWRPENYSGRFYGPTRLREAMAQSRNLVAIRLLDAVGVTYAHEYLEHFGLQRRTQPRGLSMALGSGTVTPLELTAAYAVFANGGFKISPWVIETVYDAHGRVVFAAPQRRACPQPCTHIPGSYRDPQSIEAQRVMDPAHAYQMHSILQEVIRSGTGQRAKALRRTDLAGKTGTTNDLRDAWFSGYHPQLAATAWVGFDRSSSLGGRETGASAALPIWIKFMEQALTHYPEITPPLPEGLVTVRIDPASGRRLSGDSPGGLVEALTSEQLLKIAQQPSYDGGTPAARWQLPADPIF